MKKNILVITLFDGIENSVFQSQVLSPIHKKMTLDRHLDVHIISFESKTISPEQLAQIISKHPRLSITIKRRLPILSKLNLLVPILSLARLIKKYKNDTLEIIARGPISGYVSRRALSLLSLFQPKSNFALTIQARGLAAEEHRFAAQHQNLSIIRYLYNCYKYYVLKKIEHLAYASSRKKILKIEAVSNALKEYLHNNFTTPLKNITIAHEDIPVHLPQDTYTTNRENIRKKYNFDHDHIVYCYSGSAKPWQCPQDIVADFQDRYTKNNRVRLLILTTDKDYFQQLLSKALLPKELYHIECVPNSDLITHLCGADYGYVLRKKDIINWVSRPTKLLEYQSAHLKIIHNNTIELLQTSS